MPITLARIDDRLIHGQVMTAWVQHSGATELVIVDNKVASDPFLSAVIQGAVPKHLTSHIYSEQKAIDHLKECSKPTIVLVKTPQVLENLVTNGVQIDSINIGGMGSKQGRDKFYKNIYMSDDEKTCVKRLLEQKMNVYIQVVPNLEKVDANTLLK